MEPELNQEEAQYQFRIIDADTQMWITSGVVTIDPSEEAFIEQIVQEKLALAPGYYEVTYWKL